MDNDLCLLFVHLQTHANYNIIKTINCLQMFHASVAWSFGGVVSLGSYVLDVFLCNKIDWFFNAHPFSFLQIFMNNALKEHFIPNKPSKADQRHAHIAYACVTELLNESEEWSSQLIFQFEGFNGIRTRDLRDTGAMLYSHTLGARSIYWVHIFPWGVKWREIYRK